MVCADYSVGVDVLITNLFLVQSLCTTAAYRRIRELLDQEKKVSSSVPQSI